MFTSVKKKTKHIIELQYTYRDLQILTRHTAYKFLRLLNISFIIHATYFEAQQKKFLSFS